VKRRAGALPLALGLAWAGCGGHGPAPGSSATPASNGSTDPSSRSGFSYRGLDHVSWWHDEYGYATAVEARNQLATTNSSYAGVLVTWYMPSRSANTIAPVEQRTPDDAVLAATIDELRGRGLKVMLKPHVDSLDDTWRGQIEPSDTLAWFASYTAFIQRYARLAQAHGVELFCVGTELATLSGTRHAAHWQDVIAAVRADYKGPLIYAANAVSVADEFTSVSFWNELDLAGLDAYTPLTNSTTPSVDELVRGWSRNRNGDDMLAAFRNWARSHGKPVIFTELGYRSIDGAARAPWEFNTTAAYDPQEQADCYEAAFRVWSKEPWMRGILWWAWPVPAPAPADLDYTPRGKPAEATLRSWQRP